MVNNLRRALVSTCLLLVPACTQQAAVPPGYQGVVELETGLVSFEAAGRIKEILVHRGDTVKEGAVLARLDDSLELLVRGRDPIPPDLGAHATPAEQEGNDADRDPTAPTHPRTVSDASPSAKPLEKSAVVEPWAKVRYESPRSRP
mgnify:CR=1 FL=1